jgi:hypothetical protein
VEGSGTGSFSAGGVKGCVTLGRGGSGQQQVGTPQRGSIQRLNATQATNTPANIRTSFQPILSPLPFREFLRPTPTEHGVELPLKLVGQLHRPAGFVQRYRLPDVVYDQLARVAVGQVLFQRLANRRLAEAIDVIIQCREDFFAVHGYSAAFWRL